MIALIAVRACVSMIVPPDGAVIDVVRLTAESAERAPAAVVEAVPPFATESGKLGTDGPTPKFPELST